MNKLGIISTKENLAPGSNICIFPDREYSGLQVTSGENWFDVKEKKIDLDRPIRCSELNIALQNRGFNYGLIPFPMDSYTLVFAYGKSALEIPTIGTLRGTLFQRARGSVESPTDITNTKNAVKQIKEDEVYSKILEEMDEKEINLYTSSTSSVDLVSGVRTIDLLTMNDDSYTNMVSLLPLKTVVGEGISAQVDLSILYTVAQGDGGVTYTYSTFFPAFTYTSPERVGGDYKVEEENWIEEVRNLVQIEYVNGIIKVLPLSSNVTECIISQCTVEYGRDNKTGV